MTLDNMHSPAVKNRRGEQRATGDRLAVGNASGVFGPVDYCGKRGYQVIEVGRCKSATDCRFPNLGIETPPFRLKSERTSAPNLATALRRAAVGRKIIDLGLEGKVIMIFYLALWIVPALIICVTLSFIFGTIVGAIVSTFEKLWVKVKNPSSPAMTRVWER